MRTADILSDVESVSGISSSKYRDLLRRALNGRLLQYAAAYSWPHYRARGTVQTIDDHTTGTVSVTNGSTTVTGSSAAFVALMAGRKFRVASQQTWYDIASFTDTDTIVLTQAFQGDTASGQTYTIFQDEYRLDADTHALLDMIQMEDQVLMTVFSYLDFDQLFADVGTLSDPIFLTMVGRQDDRYTTGTIALSANSRTLTGTNTVWSTLEGFGRGSRLAVETGDEVFTVDTVNSDTQVTAYELATAAQSGASYRIYLNNLRVQVRDVPSAARNLYYRKQRLPYPIVNDFDEPDMPREFHYMLVDGVLAKASEIKGQQETATKYDKVFADWVALQIRTIGSDRPAPLLIKESMDRVVGAAPIRTRLPGAFGPNFTVR